MLHLLLIHCIPSLVTLSAPCQSLHPNLFSSVPSLDPLGSQGGGGEREGQLSRDAHQLFSSGGPCEQSWHVQGCPLFDVVHLAFPLPTTVSPTLQGALKDGFGEAAVVCNVPKPCQFLFLDSYRKKFLWIHNEADLAPHQVIGLVIQVGDTENFCMHLVLKALFSETASRLHVSQPQRRMEVI